VAGSCEYGNEPSGSGATELVYIYIGLYKLIKFLNKQNNFVFKYSLFIRFFCY
jgi:hypothetical protein